MKESVDIFKALGDKTRLIILSSLLEGPMYVEILSLRSGLTPATISFHLKKLEEAGLVSSKKEQYYVLYSINEDILKREIISLIRMDKGIIKEHEERENEYHKNILDSHIIGGKLISIPVQYMKRKIVLEEIVKNFNDSRTYTEREVNIMLADYYDDFVTLRKTLLKDDLIKVYDGCYYKTSGESLSGESSDVVMDNKAVKLPLTLADILYEGEKIIYELNPRDGVFKIYGISNKSDDINRIIFSNKGRVFSIKYRANKEMVTFCYYSYSLWKIGIECRKYDDRYRCSAKKVKAMMPNSVAPMGIFDIEFSLSEYDFKALVNTFQEKLFIIKE